MSIETLKLALEALLVHEYELRKVGQSFKVEPAIKALEEALAKQKQDIPKIGCVNHDCDKCKEQIIQSYLEKDNSQQEQGEPAPVAKNENGSIKWLIDDWPQNCLLYTHPPKSFTYEQVKAHIRAASMSANDIVVGSDVTNDGVSVVIRRRDEVLYAEFFATPQQRTWVGLTDEERKDLCRSWSSPMDAIYATEAKLRSKNERL